jgi:hypothetical protein
MVISLALPLDQNVMFFLSLILYALTLIALSWVMDGPNNSIISPFWSSKGNPRKSYSKIENKKIIDLYK